VSVDSDYSDKNKDDETHQQEIESIISADSDDESIENINTKENNNQAIVLSGNRNKYVRKHDHVDIDDIITYDIFNRYSIDKLNEMISNGSNVNSQCTNGETVLFTLIRINKENDINIIKFLLEKNINPYIKNYSGIDIFNFIDNNIKSIEYIYNKNNSDNCKYNLEILNFKKNLIYEHVKSNIYFLQDQAMDIDNYNIKELLDMSKPDTINKKEILNCQLRKAIFNNFTLNRIDILIKKGVNINCLTSIGTSYLYNVHNVQIVELLYTHGIDPSIIDNRGKTALEIFKLELEILDKYIESNTENLENILRLEKLKKIIHFIENNYKNV
jgi:hypothetical protein